MAKEWIDTLAADLKEKGRDAAESYGREQHRAGIIETEGKVFFTALTLTLEQNFAEIRSRLQGSAVSSDTSLVKVNASQLKLVRSRFPWFDATLKHDAADIALEYVQGRGVAGEQSLIASAERQIVHFSFQVDTRDVLHVVESFGDNPKVFDQPEELARHMVELLFKV